VADAVTQAAAQFEGMDWAVEEVKLKIKNPEDAFSYAYTAAFAYDYKKALATQPDLVSPSLVKFAGVGVDVSGLTLMDAIYNRTTVYEIFHKFFQNFDFLVTPTVSVTAFEHDTAAPRVVPGKGTSQTNWIGFVVVCNMTGLPAASVPCGFSAENLPIGMQIIGPRLADLRVLQVAQAFEEIAPWQTKIPPIA